MPETSIHMLEAVESDLVGTVGYHSEVTFDGGFRLIGCVNGGNLTCDELRRTVGYSGPFNDLIYDRMLQMDIGVMCARREGAMGVSLGALVYATHPEHTGVRHSCITHMSEFLMDDVPAHGLTLRHVLARMGGRELRLQSSAYGQVKWGLLRVSTRGGDYGLHVIPVPTEITSGVYYHDFTPVPMRFQLDVYDIKNLVFEVKLAGDLGDAVCSKVWTATDGCQLGCGVVAGVERHLCTVCQCLVKTDGHGDRCRPVRVEVSRTVKDNAQLGDALHRVDVIIGLSSVTELKDPKGVEIARYVSGAAQAAWWKHWHAPNDVASESTLSTRFESMYLLNRELYLETVFPTVLRSVFPDYGSENSGEYVLSRMMGGLALGGVRRVSGESLMSPPSLQVPRAVTPPDGGYVSRESTPMVVLSPLMPTDVFGMSKSEIELIRVDFRRYIGALEMAVVAAASPSEVKKFELRLHTARALLSMLGKQFKRAHAE